MADPVSIRFEDEKQEDLALAKSRTNKTNRSFGRKSSDVVFDDEIEPPTDERDFRHRQTYSGWLLFWLSYQSTGVIYGDIGTSPLYVFSSTFSSEPSYDDLLGALSIIIWTLTLIVTVKYAFIVLCADDEGEGGTFAVYSLLTRYSNIMSRDPKANNLIKFERHHTGEIQPSNRGIRTFLENSRFASGVLKILAVFGVSLIMADGVLTPAQSVLGAIQGLEVVAPNLTTGTIIGVSCAVLVLLFLMQPFGVTKLGTAFAPIVVIWLIFNMSFGIYNLAKHDHSVLRAFSPYFAGLYFVRNGTEGWRSLGGILLCFTGVEALFADLGAYSKRAIQLSWLCFVYPCLLLAYIGQAAYISESPAAYSNPFFNSVPPGMFWPSLVLSILAAVVASQAIITGTFQLLSQVMNTNYFPRIKMIYTSTTHHGQVYIPWANWLLMVGTIIVTAVYSNTTRLGNAYGVCVILVTFITTCMVTLVALIVWRRNIYLVFAVFLPFITLDGLYLSSALVKVPGGAWFTIMLAIIIASVFILWRYGKEQQWAAEGRGRLPISKLVVVNKSTGRERLHDSFGGGEITTIKGLGIFFDKAGTAVPTVYEQFLRIFEARPEVHIFLHMRALSLPTIAEEDKYTVSVIPGIQNCYRIVARHGYNDQIVTKDLGNVVYTEIRKHIIRSSQGFSSPTTVAIDDAIVSGPRPDTVDSMTRASTSNSGDSMTGEVSLPDSKGMATSTSVDVPQLQSTSLPVSALSSSDGNVANALTALDRAYTTQTVYIVGKEQLRLTKGPAVTFRALFGRETFRESWSELVGSKAGRRFVLVIFMWIRENTRARVSSMKIPVEKLVEVGFVKEV